ncbi:MAG TPA: VacJ family lipoprotein [Candidatus Sulfotelmatobacter sp.]|nr:VacJ family lipoprotein [Candidatus Sulfotelmatobacter sp.]
MRRRHKTKAAALATITTAALLALTLASCATPPSDPEARADFERTNDPFEPTNRAIFQVNLVVDKWLFEPLAEGYRDVVPEFGQVTIRSFLSWLRDPTVFGNSLLQGDLTRAGHTAARFAINTLVGPIGLRDMAKQAGYPHENGDFGQTLHVWGFPEGPYLVLPILGPSNVRDAIGLGVDSIGDPVRYAAISHSGKVTWGRFGLEGVDERAQNIETFDDLKRNAVDFYAQLRSIVRQHRAAELREPAPASVNAPADLYTDPTAQRPK